MTAPFYSDERVTVHHGDCLDVLRTLPDASVDAVVTDPPYELGFMGKGWDASGIAYSIALWAECLRVLKPGGHLLAFGGTRTWHRLTCAIEDAGFEIRDTITWLYGSGFPKSLDVGKAIDKAAGAEREVVGRKGGRYASPKQDSRGGAHHSGADTSRTAIFDAVTALATEDAARWQGWGTALKPASEPIVVARKPLAGTVAGDVLTYGAGALNIDATRTQYQSDADYRRNTGFHRTATPGIFRDKPLPAPAGSREGRWPTNVVITHRGCDEECAPDCPVIELDAQGEVSRFFPTFRYQAKAPTRERPKVDGVAHPTVKPLALMSWLVRLVTPPGGTVLDPFAGSGTTVEAALTEGFRCISIEREAEYLPLILARIHRQEPAEAPRPAAEQMSLLDDPAA